MSSDDAANASRAAATSTRRTRGAVDDSNLVVLVVDDSKTIRRSARLALGAAGWSVVTATDGFDALARVVECRPDIVFADIMMPRLDGYQTCALIKNNAEFRETPVVLLSSRDGLFDRARGRVVGVDAHLSKPFSAELLIEAVRQHVPGADTAARVDPSEQADKVADGEQTSQAAAQSQPNPPLQAATATDTVRARKLRTGTRIAARTGGRESADASERTRHEPSEA